MKKQNKGITLIALIITIIVMLILVGVTVSVALNGGLFTTTKHAADRTQEEKEKEIIGSAYIEYIAKTYSEMEKPEDFDMLETYFLGQAKNGIDINEKIDTEKSKDNIIVFKDIDITVNEMTDLSASEDEKYMYITFEYKGNKYKLTCDYNTGVTSKLEIEPTLELADAEVTGNENEGWDIKFDNGNKYYLLPDGRITNKWWTLTDEENVQIKDDTAESGTYIVAEKDNILIGLGRINGRESYDCLVLIVGEDHYYFMMNSYAAKYIEEEGNIDKGKVEAFKWYSSGYGYKNFKEYIGTAPITLDDFTDEQIYCKSYLERIINSFNN